MLTVASGASLLLKGIAITEGAADAPTDFDTIEDNGNLVVDNVSMYNNTGSAISVDQLTTVPSATVDNSSIANGQYDGIENNSGNLTLNNTTVADNNTGGIEIGLTAVSTVLNNTMVIANDNVNADCYGSGSVTSQDDSLDDDGSCNVTYSGVADSSIGLPAGENLVYVGGPTLVYKTTGPAPINAGDAAVCLPDDQRFFRRGSGCDIGAYQTTGTSQATDTTPPTCTVPPGGIVESNDPKIASTETVDATDPAGIGPDANVVGTFTRGSGTVAVPTITDAASVLPVTASKPVGDLTVGDTQWSFTVTDWLGNTATCQ
jgi:hypothetical protein